MGTASILKRSKWQESPQSQWKYMNFSQIDMQYNVSGRWALLKLINKDRCDFLYARNFVLQKHRSRVIRHAMYAMVLVRSPKDLPILPLATCAKSPVTLLIFLLNTICTRHRVLVLRLNIACISPCWTSEARMPPKTAFPAVD